MLEWADCEECGEEFSRDDSEWWKRLCYPCWKEKKRREESAVSAVDHRAEMLSRTVAALSQRVGLLEDELDAKKETIDALKYHLNFLIFAAHPDRNNMDPRANEVTRWLLELREFFKGR